MESQPLSINELKDAFFSLKINKSPGHDGVSFNVIRKCFGELCEPSKYLFNPSLIKEIFPNDLKIVKVTLQYIKLTTAVMLVIIGQYLCYRVFLKC